MLHGSVRLQEAETASSSGRSRSASAMAELFAPLASTPGAFGLTDDAAILPERAEHDVVLPGDRQTLLDALDDPRDPLFPSDLRIALPAEHPANRPRPAEPLACKECGRQRHEQWRAAARYRIDVGQMAGSVGANEKQAVANLQGHRQRDEAPTLKRRLGRRERHRERDQ